MARRKRRRRTRRKTARKTRRRRVSRATIMREAWRYMHRHGVSLREALKAVWKKYR